MSNWKRLASKIVYQNDWKTVHEDEVIRPDGRSTVYAWFETPPAVLVVAVNDNDEVCLVQQERYTTGNLSWELPAGNIDGADELPAAKRGLAEETHLHADHWERLPGEMHPFIGTAASRSIIFIATGLHQVRGEVPQSEETITAVRWVGWRELKEMLKTAVITDGQSISALALAGLHLGQI